jgi:hypothetical protein
MKLKISIIALALTGMWACQPELNEFTPSKGNADFTTYMSAGNSLTAGYSDGALYKSGQENSYAAILAKQLETVGRTGEFRIPFIESEDGVGTRGGALVTKMKMGFSTDCKGVQSPSPVLANPNATQQELAVLIGTPVGANGPYNNVGVPGAKVGHLLAPGYGSLNPYYGRFASAPGNAVVNEFATVQPTFFSLWIGNNDVLGYATSGGIGDVITPVSGDPGFGFAASYEAIVQYFEFTATAGVVANIPDITSVPFFTTVPYNPIVLTDQAQVDALNAGYAAYNGAMQLFGSELRINWTLGQNPMVIADASIQVPAGYEALKMRQITAEELVLLSIPQDSIKCGGWGSLKPVPDQFILTSQEKTNVANAVASYNEVIAGVAEAHDLALVDANKYMKLASNGGLKMDGVMFTNAFVTGNLFSTDGVHLTPQGNAVVANFFIDAINEKYNSKIPKVPVSEYNAVLLP